MASDLNQQRMSRDIPVMNKLKIHMKRLYTIITVIVLISACGNAGAQNEKKDAKVTHSGAVTELDAIQFDEKIYDMEAEGLEYLGDKPAIVDFTASWCGPCQRIAPVLEELAAEYKGKIVVYKVDIDKERGLAEAFGISSIPAILYIPADGGKPVITVGVRNKEKFKSEIQTYLLK